MSTGLATRTIVLIIIGLLVLGIIATLLFVGLGPFKIAVEYYQCKAKFERWCTTDGDYNEIMGDCLQKSFPGHKPFPQTGDLAKGPNCDPKTSVCCPL